MLKKVVVCLLLTGAVFAGLGVGESQASSILVLTRNAASLDIEEQGVVDFLAKEGYPYILVDPANLAQYFTRPDLYKLAIFRTGAEPTAYNNADLIQVTNAYLEKGGNLLVQFFGGYLVQYCSLGTVIVNGWWPAVDGAAYFVKPFHPHPLFNGLSTWDPPTEPDLPEQLIYQVKRGSYDRRYLDINTPDNPWELVQAYQLLTSYGWNGQETNSDYCREWGGCRGDRSVHEDALGSLLTMAFKRVGKGKVIGHYVGGFNRYFDCNIPLLQVGQKSQELFRNLVNWVNQRTPMQILPAEGGNAGSVSVIILGFGFQPGATVHLQREGLAPIAGDPVVVAGDNERINTSFDLRGRSAGVWDVVVTNPDNTSKKAARGFTITAGGAPQVWVDIVGRDTIRAGTPATFTVTYGNRGNLDLQEDHVLVIDWPLDAQVTIDNVRSPYDQAPPPPLIEGDRQAIGLFVPHLPPGSVNTFNLRLATPAAQTNIGVALVSPSSFPVPADLLNLKEKEASTREKAAPLPDDHTWEGESNTARKYPVAMASNDAPPVGSTVFVAPNEDNPYGHEALVGEKNGQIGVWDHFLATFPQLSGYDGFFPMETWKQLLGGNYLGWGTPPGWNDDLGLKAADFAKQWFKESIPVYDTWWSKNILNKGYSCTGLVEKIYESIGLDPIDFNNLDPFYLTPGLHYRYFTGKKDFYTRASNVYLRVLISFWVNSLRDLLKGKALDRMRQMKLMLEKQVRVVASIDPNDKLGSKGVRKARYLSGEEPLRYNILFENKKEATAPAQQVLISDRLPRSLLDLKSFSLGTISFGYRQITPPPGLREYVTEVDLRPDKDLLVRLEAGLDLTTSSVTWRFTSLDPATGKPPEDPLAGFLPPNVTAPEGEGSVLFTVKTKPGLETGVRVRNKANITFDNNEPITTPLWRNALDNSKPVSQVLPLSPVQADKTFTVQWSGTDTGAGIKDYTIYVSRNGRPYKVWLKNVKKTSRQFFGVSGRKYSFYSVAQDLVGNMEEPPLTPDATTRTP